jgi:O-antigen/teichoic acid export membrane protein
MPAAANPPQRRGSPLRRRSGLAVHIGFNGVAQAAPIVATLAVTPLLLHRLGLDRFGIWSLAIVALSTLTALDGGVSASLTRFFAVYSVSNDRAETGRLALASLLFFGGIGLLLSLIALPLAPAIVGLIHIPAALEDEAILVLRAVPGLVLLALVADGTAALLQGHGRFRALAVTMVSSSAVLVAAILALTHQGASLGPLIVATALRYLTLIVVGLLLAARHVSFRRPFLPSRVTVRELGGYASRMQLTALTSFVNGELDAFVIAAVLPVRYVGLYSVGMQAASGARSLPLYAFTPVLTRLTTTFRREGRAAAAADFERLERRWLPGVLGYGIVAVAAIGVSIPVWLGDRYALGGVVAAVLLAGYVVHVGFTGMRTCYVRAVGRPGLETRYAVVWTIGNALFTVPLALVAGVVGVVSVTAVTALIASLYFVVLCRRAEQLQVILPQRRWWCFAAVAVGVTVAGELAILQTGLHGFLALGLTGVPALVALAIFAAGLGEFAALNMTAGPPTAARAGPRA